MKQFNDITIIGIDQGYGNMKTANTIFPTAITAYDTAPMFKGDVLEYGGKFYRVGEGHKGFVADCKPLATPHPCCKLPSAVSLPSKLPR